MMIQCRGMNEWHMPIPCINTSSNQCHFRDTYLNMSDLFQRNKQIAFIGNGALAEQFKVFLGLKEKDYVVFDDSSVNEHANAFPFEDYGKYAKDYVWVIALGYLHLQRKYRIYQELKKLGGQFLAFAHPSSFQSPLSCLDTGVFIYPLCNIDMRASIGAQSLLNNSVVVSHDATIGDACFLSPGVVISGNVSIGKCTFIGAGSVVSNNVNIGENVVIGSHTSVTKDIPSNSFVIGNPMRIVNKIELR